VSFSNTNAAIVRQDRRTRYAHERRQFPFPGHRKIEFGHAFGQGYFHPNRAALRLRFLHRAADSMRLEHDAMFIRFLGDRHSTVRLLANVDWSIAVIEKAPVLREEVA